MLVILVTLGAAGGTVFWLVRDTRRELALNHMRELTLVATATAWQLERQGAGPEEIVAFVAGQLTAALGRVLVADGEGRVLAEQAVGDGAAPALFSGRLLALPPLREQAVGPDAKPIMHSVGAGGLSGLVADWQTGAAWPGARYTFLVVQGPLPIPGEGPEAVGRFTPARPQYRIVLVVPTSGLAGAWGELLLALGRAAALGGVAAVGVSLWLAASIVRPVRRLTRAAEAIAGGAWRQQVPEDGGPELARLARAFTTMSRGIERSQRVLRDFVADASHELRTPLTSIQGFVDALLEGVPDDPEAERQALRIVADEAERMRRLVDALLLLSAAEAPPQPGEEATVVDAAALLRGLARRLEPVARERGLTLRLDLPGPLPVRGDAGHLEQLFGNLLENAGKYTPAGGTVTVRGRSLRPSAAGPVVEVRVHNTGSSIPPADLPLIFERFHRVEKSRSRKVGGTGLGLAIAREVCARYGGTIRAESDPGAGTAFTVTLPLAPAPDVPPPSKPPARRLPDQRTPANERPVPAPTH